MTPQTPGLVATALPSLYLADNAAMNAALLQKPDIVGTFLQNNPDADLQMQRLFSKLASFKKSARGNMTWQNTYVDNQFQNLHVLAHAGGAAGAAVNITIAPASHMNGTPLAYEGYAYYGYSSITGQSFNGYVRPGGITKTSGAWVLAMRPTNATTGVIPAQALGDPLRLLQPVTAEGNTTHLQSGRKTNIYSETKTMQIMQDEAISLTDLAAFSEMTWTFGKYAVDGKDVSTQLWSIREISLGMKSWHDNDMWGRLFNDGEMVVTDANARYSTEGLWHWIENSGGNLFTFTGTITNADIEAWIIQLQRTYEGIKNYIIVSGREVTTAFQNWARGGHINGQIFTIDRSLDLDFQQFTYNGFTFSFPIEPFNEMDNEFGLGEFNFSSKALFIPRATTTANSVGEQVPYVEWVFLGNNNPIFDGLEGADKMWWELGPSFLPSMPTSGQKVIPTNNDTATVFRKKTEGNNFKKAQVFAILQR